MRFKLKIASSLMAIALLFWFCKDFNKNKMSISSTVNQNLINTIQFKMLGWKIEDEIYIPIPYELEKWNAEMSYKVSFSDAANTVDEPESKIGNFTAIAPHQDNYQKIGDIKQLNSNEVVERATPTNIQETKGILRFDLNNVLFKEKYKILQLLDAQGKIIENILFVQPLAEPTADSPYFSDLHETKDLKDKEPMLIRYTKTGETEPQYLGLWFGQTRIYLPPKLTKQELESMNFDLILTNKNAIHLTPNTENLFETITLNHVNQTFSFEQNMIQDVRITQPKEPQFLKNTCKTNDEFDVFYINKTDYSLKQIKASTEQTEKSGVIYYNEKQPVACQSSVVYLIDCGGTEKYQPENGYIACATTFEQRADLVKLEVMQEGNSIEKPSNPNHPKPTVAAPSGAQVFNVSKNVSDGGKGQEKIKIQQITISPYAQFSTGPGAWTPTTQDGIVKLTEDFLVNVGFAINIKSRDGKKETSNKIGYKYLNDESKILSISATQNNNTKTTASLIHGNSHDNINGSPSLTMGEIKIENVYFSDAPLKIDITIPANATIRLNDNQQDEVISNNNFNYKTPKTGDIITVYAEDGRYNKYRVVVNNMINLNIETKADKVDDLNKVIRLGAGDIDAHRLHFADLKTNQYSLVMLTGKSNSGGSLAIFDPIPLNVQDNKGTINLFFSDLNNLENHNKNLEKWLDDTQAKDGLYTLKFELKTATESILFFEIKIEREMYKIKNCYDLQGMRHDTRTSASYYIHKTINCETDKIDNFKPIVHFGGTLNGASEQNGKWQRYTIEKLKINKPTDQVGLFETLTGKVINLTLLEPAVSGKNKVGALAGINEGTIIASAVHGYAASSGFKGSNLKNVSGDSDIGGLVGENKGTISYSFVDGAYLNANGNLGGLVGNMKNGTINGSFAAADLRGNTVGGLVGTMDAGNINQAYAVTKVTGNPTHFEPLTRGKTGGNMKHTYGITQKGNENKYAHYDVAGARTVSTEVVTQSNLKNNISKLQLAGNIPAAMGIVAKNNTLITLNNGSTFYLRSIKNNSIFTPIITSGTQMVDNYPILFWALEGEAGDYDTDNFSIISLDHFKNTQQTNINLTLAPTSSAGKYTLSKPINTLEVGQEIVIEVLNTDFSYDHLPITSDELKKYIGLTVSTTQYTLTKETNKIKVTLTNTTTDGDTSADFYIGFNVISTEASVKQIILKAATTTLATVPFNNDNFSGQVLNGSGANAGTITFDKINRNHTYKINTIDFFGKNLEIIKTGTATLTCTANPCTATVIPTSDTFFDHVSGNKIEDYSIKVTSSTGSEIADYQLKANYLDDQTLIQKATFNAQGDDMVTRMNVAMTAGGTNEFIATVYSDEKIFLSEDHFIFPANSKIAKVAYQKLGGTVTNLNAMLVPIANKTENADFTIIVTAEDGRTKDYTIKIKRLSNEALITEFKVAGVTVTPTPTPSVNPVGTNTILHSDPKLQNMGSITINVPLIDFNTLKTVKPTITLSTGAKVLPLANTSVNLQDPQIYTVTAEDGKTIRKYKVTVNSSCQIGTEADLKALPLNNPDIYCVLIKDIILTGNWVPLNNFTGILDGRDYTIYNLNINLSSTDNVGFFSTIKTANTIKNLSFQDAIVTGRNNVGILVGAQDANTNYHNIRVKNSSVTGVDNIGGIVGNISWASAGSNLKNSYVKNTEIKGKTGVGGLVGFLDGGTITECFFNGNVEATAGYAAGIARGNTLYTQVRMYHVYSNGKIKASGEAIGIGYGETINNYYSAAVIEGLQVKLAVPFSTNFSIPFVPEYFKCPSTDPGCPLKLFSPTESCTKFSTTSGGSSRPNCVRIILLNDIRKPATFQNTNVFPNNNWEFYNDGRWPTLKNTPEEP